MNTRRCTVIVTAALSGVVLAAPAAWAADRTPPAAPTNLRVTGVSDVKMTLAWNASSDDGGVVNYELFFDGNPTPILTGDPRWTQNLNHAIGMRPGSTHTFRVRAEDMSGNVSGFSNTLTARFLAGDNTPPTTPTDLRVVSNTTRGIELAWDASTGDASVTYRVWTSGFRFDAREPHLLLTPNAPVQGLLPGTTHTFRVQAADKLFNASGFSNPVTATFAK